MSLISVIAPLSSHRFVWDIFETQKRIIGPVGVKGFEGIVLTGMNFTRKVSVRLNGMSRPGALGGQRQPFAIGLKRRNDVSISGLNREESNDGNQGVGLAWG
jgi:hypothetical protein